MKAKLTNKIIMTKEMLDDLKKYRERFHEMFLERMESDSFSDVDNVLFKTIQNINNQIRLLQAELHDLDNVLFLKSIS